MLYTADSTRSTCRGHYTSGMYSSHTPWGHYTPGTHSSYTPCCMQQKQPDQLSQDIIHIRNTQQSYCMLHAAETTCCTQQTQPDQLSQDIIHIRNTQQSYCMLHAAEHHAAYSRHNHINSYRTLYIRNAYQLTRSTFTGHYITGPHSGHIPHRTQQFFQTFQAFHK